MDIIAHAKNIGTMLAAAASLTYIAGYLALRARANALGTDPVFTLVDEAYIFAGFRFFFITLIVVICLTPIMIPIFFSTQWMNSRLSSIWSRIFQWILLVIMAIITLISLKILNINSILLQRDLAENNTVLMRAIMGTENEYGLLVTFGMVFLTISAAYWLKIKIPSGFDSFNCILSVIVTLLFFMLPIYHGALFADRKVRLLGTIPAVAKGISEPAGIVEHTKEHYTLFGLNERGDPSLITIKQDDLNGIPINKILSLKVFMDLLTADNSIHGGTIDNNKKKESKKTAIHKTFFKVLTDELHMLFKSIASLGDGAVHAGELWSVQIDASGTPSERKRLGSLSNLSWPVAHPNGSIIYALQNNKLVRLINNYNDAEVVNKSVNWIKLLGVTEDGTILGLIYKDNKTKPVILYDTGEMKIHHSTLSTDDQLRLSRLLQESRSYTDNRTLFVDRSEKGNQGFDVYLKSGNRSINLSDCADDNCGQASISKDFHSALFIREPLF